MTIICDEFSIIVLCIPVYKSIPRFGDKVDYYLVDSQDFITLRIHYFIALIKADFRILFVKVLYVPTSWYNFISIKYFL